MRTLINVLYTSLLLSSSASGFADGCCKGMGGISYCDSSAGRLICKNGFFSACYCTRHAVMDLQLLTGCCLWRGGVFPTYDDNGLIVCNDGSISEECSLQNPEERIATW